MRFETRPLPAAWPGGQRTPVSERQNGRFKAPAGATWDLLEYELSLLVALGHGIVTVEAGYKPHQIRGDGRPRAGASPDDPAVILSFESRHGPLRYWCDTYWRHEHNLRALALSLEALRAVERYGVLNRGEQYTGNLALPPAGAAGMTRDEAEAFIRHHGADGLDVVGQTLDVLWRRAAKRMHPDVGGDPAEWRKLDRARQALGL